MRLVHKDMKNSDSSEPFLITSIFGNNGANSEDILTGLPRVETWFSYLENDKYKLSGSIIALSVAPHPACLLEPVHALRALLPIIVRRMRLLLPDETVILSGPRQSLIIWLPQVDDMMGEAYASLISRSILSREIMLPGGELTTPIISIITRQLKPNEDFQKQIDAICRNLAKVSPLTNAVYVDHPATIQLLSLEEQIQKMALFGRQGTIEAIARWLNLPALTPSMALVIGPSEVGKVHLLSSLSFFFVGDGLPIADVVCHSHAYRQQFGLILIILEQFIASSSPKNLSRLLSPLLRLHPWLSALLQNGQREVDGLLNGLEIDQDTLAQVLTQVLEMMVANSPHLAIIHRIHDADRASFNIIRSVMKMRHHGLRLIISSEGSHAPELVENFGATLKMFKLSPYTEAEVAEYLHEIAGGNSLKKLSSQFFSETGGYIVRMEHCLRSWVLDDIIFLRDGVWQIKVQQLELKSPVATNDDTSKEKKNIAVDQLSTKQQMSPLVIISVIAAILCLSIVFVLAQSRKSGTIPSSQSSNNVVTRRNVIDDATMINIPAGIAKLGATAQEISDILRTHPEWKADMPANLPAQEVNVASYWIYKYEVTVGQYKAFCRATGKQDPPGAHDLPVCGITWADADTYCKWAGGRLPTEVEWEKAARGTNGAKYPWGNNWDPTMTPDGKLGLAGSQATDVSPFDVHDMAGSVAEWCSDAGSNGHVVRGGSFISNHPEFIYRCTSRQIRGDQEKSVDVGFRCVTDDDGKR